MRLALAIGAAAALLAVSGTASPGVQVDKSCTTARTRALVQRFVTSFNRGDARTLNRVWGSKDWFKWYSVSNEPGRRVNADAIRRDTLLPYFAARHEAHELLTLMSVKINAYSFGFRDFLSSLSRSADDLPGSPVVYSAKGTYNCFTRRLDVWSMGAGT
jgi:hypothetical protein